MSKGQLFKSDDFPFSQIPDSFAEDPDLTPKAKGIMLSLASKPNGWEFRQTRIQQEHDAGEHAIRTGLEELEERGYIQRERTRDENGHLGPYDYHLNFFPGGGGEPENNDQVGKSDVAEQPAKTGKSSLDNQGEETQSHTKKQETKSVCVGADAREENTTNTDSKESSAFGPTARFFQDKLDCPEREDGDRVDPLEIQQWWRELTDGRIQAHAPGYRDDVEAVCRTFSEAEIREAMEIAAEPGVSHRWSYFTGVLKRWAKDGELETMESSSSSSADDTYPDEWPQWLKDMNAGRRTKDRIWESEQRLDEAGVMPGEESA